MNMITYKNIKIDNSKRFSNTLWFKII